MMKQNFVKWLLMAIMLPMSAAVYAGFHPTGEGFTINGINYVVTSENPLACEVAPGDYSGNITIEATVTDIITTYAVMRVGDEAFAGNTGLTSVTLPSSIESIGAGAFAGCTGLKEIHLQNPEPGFLGAGAIDPSVPVYVPVGSKEAYKAADGWKDLKILEEGESDREPGDVTGDGAINSSDVQRVYYLMAKSATPATNPEGDVNLDGYINSGDIQRIYAIMASQSAN
jgi:hypothetical protein